MKVILACNYLLLFTAILSDETLCFSISLSVSITLFPLSYPFLSHHKHALSLFRSPSLNTSPCQAKIKLQIKLIAEEIASPAEK